MLAHRATCTETPHEVPQPLHVVPFRALMVDLYADAVPLGHNARLCACLLGFGLGGEEVEEVLKGLTANSKEYLPVAILPLTASPCTQRTQLARHDLVFREAPSDS